MLAYYTKSLNDIKLSPNHVVHTTDDGAVTLCGKQIKGTGRWMLVTCVNKIEPMCKKCGKTNA